MCGCREGNRRSCVDTPLSKALALTLTKRGSFAIKLTFVEGV